MSGFRTYLLSVAAASLVLGVISSVIAQKSTRQVAQLIGALLLVLTVIAPVVKLDTKRFDVLIEELHPDASDLQQEAQEQRELMLEQIIKEQCEAYILDRSRQLGISVQIEVIVEASEGYPHPVGVRLTGEVGDTEKTLLGDVIEQGLGIPLEHQEWVEHD